MRYLLDSDVVSDFYETTAPSHPRLAEKFASLGQSDSLAISLLFLYEAEYGYANAVAEKRKIIRKRIEASQSDFEVLPLPPGGSRIYGEIKKELVTRRGLGKKASKIHAVDIMIAATAIVEDCTLVSGDSIFRDLQGLNRALGVEDWFQSSP